jgi:hypothetical protein
MDTNHYKFRPGETNATMAARALGVQSAKDLTSLFDPSISVGPDRHRIDAYQDNRNTDRIATVATSSERDFYGNTTGRATVSTMTRKEWDAAYDRAEESTRPAYAEGDGHFVQALMNEVRTAKPGYAHRGPQYADDYYADEPSNEFQPRAPGRIKSAAAAAQTKKVQPAVRSHQGDAR